MKKFLYIALLASSSIMIATQDLNPKPNDTSNVQDVCPGGPTCLNCSVFTPGACQTCCENYNNCLNNGYSSSMCLVQWSPCFQKNKCQAKELTEKIKHEMMQLKQLLEDIETSHSPVE